MDDGTSVKCEYRFRFENGRELSYTLYLSPDRKELLRIEPYIDKKPEWALLGYSKCENCSLEPDEHRYCPVAVNIIQVIENFKDISSLEPVKVTVTTPERITLRETPIQYALGSLLGLCNAISGCPILSRFAPLARFHLPFSTVDETLYRTIADYLLEQYCKYKNGETPDWDLKGLEDFYVEVEKVNKALCNRFRGVCVSDANLNAVITLDSYVKNVIYLMKHNVEKLKTLYNVK